MAKHERLFMKNSGTCRHWFNIVENDKSMCSDLEYGVFHDVKMLYSGFKCWKKAREKLLKIKKQNKELTSKIKALSGETDEEEIIIDAEVETTENVEENTAEIAKITDAVDAKVENVTIEEDSAEKTE